MGTEHPLAAQVLAVGLVRIVATQDAVPVQCLDLAAAGTALLLEGKSASFSAGSSRTK
ncbi:MAG TPA: hypothetical protein VFZ59_03435 [Verrucomicrobiae bacterium]|nr:hypothetical protein [Verrucomicrobiae bacterium]